MNCLRGSSRRARQSPKELHPDSAAQEQPVSCVVRLLLEQVTELLQLPVEPGALLGRDLQTHEHPSVIGAMVAVVEQRDVPGMQAVEELLQRSGALGELGPEHQFLTDRAGPSP